MAYGTSSPTTAMTQHPASPPPTGAASADAKPVPDTRSEAAPADGASASLKPVDNGRNPPAGDMPHASVDLTVPNRSSAPGTPHERDETVGMTGGVPSRRVEQAFDDVEAGRSDTSRANETDRAYRQLKDGH
jgi:hypothetical protein